VYVLDEERTDSTTNTSTDPGTADSTAGGAEGARPTRRRRSASRPAGPPTPSSEVTAAPPAPAADTAADVGGQTGDAPADSPAPRKRTRKKAVAADPVADTASGEPSSAAEAAPEEAARPARRSRRAPAAAPFTAPAADSSDSPDADSGSREPAVPVVLFQPPAPAAPAPRRRTAATPSADSDESGSETDADALSDDGLEDGGGRSARRRRGRRGRGGRGGADTGESPEGTSADAADDGRGEQGGDDADADEHGEPGTGTSSRRRRRRRRTSGQGEGPDGTSPDDPPNTVVHVREPRRAAADDGVRGVKGSTRIEAKRQRRRDGRDTGRRRPSIITEAEFLARREAVDRVMVVRQGDERTQIAVLEDGVLVEHYVTRKDAASMVGNVYLGKVQNVLPSMEAAFVDIGRGRNAVLYAGEVNYDASALEGRPPRIEQALKSGQSVLVQVTKDPIGHKGGRLTSQVSLPGRYMVYVPDGRLSGISRKLPDTERSRLKGILKRLTPDDAGVIIRTAAEGATEEALERDLNRLKAQWEVISTKSKTASAPSLIYSEPDLVIRVIRDIFNEDFSSLVVQGADEWDTVDNYVRWVAPDLAERTRRWTEDGDVFAEYRVDEQLAKALDRKVWLPSGGYLIIDRTEAMVVVDVNTGKFTGKGGNLEETVTKNNLEAAEEIVRQLRLRDLGGIIVIDFIDMVLESNRDLVLRRLVECLGRDRTRHQVAEVTSLGLVQMTRKRVGEGLLESFSETCKECGGSGVILTVDPVADRRPAKQAQAGKDKAGSSQKGSTEKGSSDKKSTEKKATEKKSKTKAAEPAAEAASAGSDESAPRSGRRSRSAASRPAGPPADAAVADGEASSEPVDVVPTEAEAVAAGS
jgi:ribonuclease E